MADDLWPENIAESNLVTPVSILKQQAALLGERTKELVKGEVVTQISGTLLIHHFCLVAPTLSYRYELFTASHGVSFYPLTLTYINPVSIKSEAELKENLKRVFSSQHTVNIVHSILAQVRS